MPNEPEQGDESTVDEVAEQVETESQDAVETESETEATEDAGEETETVVSFGAPKTAADEPEAESSTFRELRKKLRETERRARQQEAELAQMKAPAKPKLGPRPTQADSDFDIDKHEAALEQWLKQKAKVEAEEGEAQKAQEAQAQEWGQTVHRYREAKTALRVPDFSESEEAVAGALSLVQQNIILAATDRPEAVVYALGKDDSRLADLAKIKDPVKFAAAIAKLETTLMVTTAKKSPPKPARTVNGTKPGAGPTSKALDRLEDEASKTGDRSKVIAYKREQKLAKG